MKLKALLAVCAGVMVAGPALADDTPRDVVEANMSARMRTAEASLATGIEALKAGNQAKGCADLHASSDDLSKVLELLTQEAALIKVDNTLSPSEREDGLNKAQFAQTNVTTTYNNLNDIIKQHCS
ncbi:MAG TPA: hypothetical protein VG839_06915 [Asticcacaulis sp.]|nr:hypothetical protein [Asticcacaulis sp.]